MIMAQQSLRTLLTVSLLKYTKQSAWLWHAELSYASLAKKLAVTIEKGKTTALPQPLCIRVRGVTTIPLLRTIVADE